jgi:hypothetical protein
MCLSSRCLFRVVFGVLVVGVVAEHGEQDVATSASPGRSGRHCASCSRRVCGRSRRGTATQYRRHGTNLPDVQFLHGGHLRRSRRGLHGGRLSRP